VREVDETEINNGVYRVSNANSNRYVLTCTLYANRTQAVYTNHWR